MYLRPVRDRRLLLSLVPVPPLDKLGTLANGRKTRSGRRALPHLTLLAVLRPSLLRGMMYRQL